MGEPKPAMLSSTISTSRAYLLLTPLLLPFGAVFGLGILLALAQSLGYYSPVALPAFEQHGPLAAYGALFSPRMFASLGISLFVACVSASAATLLGGVLAYGVWKLPPRLQGPATIYKIPLILPHIAVGFIVLVLFTRTGFVASACHQLGFINRAEEFPQLLFSGSGLGMILAYVLKSTPFVILMAHAVLRRLDPRLIETARMLGASRLRAFTSIVLPALSPVLNSTFIILFLYNFGAFDIPYILGESAPAMLSIEAYNLYFRRALADRPTAMAILCCIFLFSAVFIVLYTHLTRRLSGEARKV